LRWAWERSADAFKEHDWLVLIRDALMHQGTVSVLLNVSSESLALLTPHGLAWLLTLDCPCFEPGEALLCLSSRKRAHEIDESMAEILSASSGIFKINRQVNKIKLSSEALRFQLSEQHRSGQRPRHVAQHECRVHAWCGRSLVLLCCRTTRPACAAVHHAHRCLSLKGCFCELSHSGAKFGFSRLQGNTHAGGNTLLCSEVWCHDRNPEKAWLGRGHGY